MLRVQVEGAYPDIRNTPQGLDLSVQGVKSLGVWGLRV